MMSVVTKWRVTMGITEKNEKSNQEKTIFIFAANLNELLTTVAKIEFFPFEAGMIKWVTMESVK